MEIVGIKKKTKHILHKQKIVYNNNLDFYGFLWEVKLKLEVEQNVTSTVIHKILSMITRKDSDLQYVVYTYFYLPE